MAKKKKVTVWQPQPGPQEAAIRAPFVHELFYGGAAGGGKSDYLLGDFLVDVGQGPAWSGILFRQSYPALEELVERSHQIYPKTGAVYKVGASEWRWPNGAVLKFRHMENLFDFTKYQGHSYSWIGWDELPEWSNGDCYNRMKSRLRGVAENKRIRSTGNPGGVGHGWVQAYFRIPSEKTTYKEAVPFTDPDTEMTRLFIPSRVQDNKILMEADPLYINRLKGVGDEELVKAWLEGDWSALVGAYFGSVWHKVELVESFDIPDSWTLFSGLDYGEASPTCWLMGAVDYDKNLYIINEYYQDERSTSEQAAEINDLREGFPYTQRKATRNVADPSLFIKRKLEESKGISAGDIFRQHGLYFKPGNNKRINGWRVLKDVMSKGKLKIFKEWCPNLIRTMPAIPRDERNPEDVDTTCFRGSERFITPSGPISFEDAVGTSGIALTRHGWRPYVWCKRKQELSDVVEVTFADNSRVVCTPDHRFYVEGRGWTEAKNTQGLYCLTARSGFATSRDTTETGSASRCTGGYGRQRTEPSPHPTRFTTLTETDTITTYPTSSVYPKRSIEGLSHETQIPHQPERLHTSETLRRPVLSVEKDSPLEGSGSRGHDFAAGSAETSILQLQESLPQPVQFAESDSCRGTSQGLERRADTSAGGSYVVSVRKMPNREWVYCINVPDVHEFVLESGLVVHNSEDHAADALRYLAVHVYGPGKKAQDRPNTEGARLIDSITKPIVGAGRYA